MSSVELLFFDIECASVHKNCAKICAFGYVLCDEQFNIIEKEDILVNPRGKFELTDRKGEKGIVLPYEYGEFKKQPPFPAVYKRIKKLLEAENRLVLGHAVLNDVKYLNLETKRFKLPSFRFRFGDSQLMFMSLKNDYSRQFGLEYIAEDLNVEFTPHRAADDAYATMRIVEAMCKSCGCTVKELYAKIGFTEGKIENFSVTRPQSKGFKQYKADKLQAKAERSQARIKFYNNLTRKRAVKNRKLGGKVFTFSRQIEDDVDKSIALVDAIYEQGGKYSQHVEECYYYIRPDGDETDRTKKAVKAQKCVINTEALSELLND